MHINKNNKIKIISNKNKNSNKCINNNNIDNNK